MVRSSKRRTRLRMDIEKERTVGGCCGTWKGDAVIRWEWGQSGAKGRVRCHHRGRRATGLGLQKANSVTAALLATKVTSRNSGRRLRPRRLRSPPEDHCLVVTLQSLTAIPAIDKQDVHLRK